MERIDPIRSRTTRRVAQIVGIAAVTASALLVATGFPHAVDPTTAPMIEEDVVRRVLAGRDPDDIVAEIERRDVRFDTSQEMLGELRTAGVPITVIDAMVRRQRELDAARQPAVDPALPPEPASPVVRVSLSGPDEPVTVVVDRTITPVLESQLQLSTSAEPRQIEDVAVYLACKRAEHVPDHWRSQSPLGRDFVTMPRHRMLAFVAGSRLESDRLQLTLPPRLEAELSEAGPHDLIIGVAVQIEGRYSRITDDALEIEHVVDGAAELAAWVESSRKGRRLEVRWLSP